MLERLRVFNDRLKQHPVLRWVRRWLAPPVFPGDAEKTRRAELINATLVIVLLYTLTLALGALLGGRAAPLTIAITLSIGASTLITRNLLHKGWLTFVVIWIILIGTLGITLATASIGTIRSPATATYMFIVIIAVHMFGLAGLFISTISVSLAVGVLILLENAGRLPAPDYTVTITQWITYTFLFGLVGYLTLLSYRSYIEALKRNQQEIEERKRTEEALRESEIRWQFALEGSGDGLWDWNALTDKVYFSPVWKTMLGYDLDEIGDTLAEWDTRIHPDDRERTYAEINRHFTGEAENYTSEHRLRCKDGSYKWILDRGKIISRDADGKPLRVIGTHTDISLRKSTEQALRQSEARFRSLFEQTHDAVFILDLEGRHLAVNQRAADMLGYTADEMVGFSAREVSVEYQESQNVLDLLLSGKHVPVYERKFRKKNGEILPVEISAELVRDKDGNPMHIQSLARDISRRKIAEAALKAANDQLSLRVAEIEQLQEDLRQQALHDPLTGLYNRRYLAEMLEHEVARSEREGISLSIIVSDIDHFKDINDTCGHQTGDRFLVEIAALLRQTTRSSDLICRYGGEEFILVFPGADSRSATQRAEDIRRKCSEIVIDHEGQAYSVTMSFGIAVYPEHGKTGEEVIIKADKALYASKQAGRNRVAVWSNGKS